MKKKQLLNFPNQLFEKKYWKEYDYEKIYLIGDPIYFGFRRGKYMKFNKKKLILHRSSMKYYQKYLEKHKYHVEYIEYHQIQKTKKKYSFFSKNQFNVIHFIFMIMN